MSTRTFLSCRDKLIIFLIRTRSSNQIVRIIFKTIQRVSVVRPHETIVMPFSWKCHTSQHLSILNSSKHFVNLEASSKGLARCIHKSLSLPSSSSVNQSNSSLPPSKLNYFHVPLSTSAVAAVAASWSFSQPSHCPPLLGHRQPLSSSRL